MAKQELKAKPKAKQNGILTPTEKENTKTQYDEIYDKCHI